MKNQHPSLKNKYIIFSCISLYFWLFFLALPLFAQSGRVKPSETPTPKTTPRIVYLPTQNKSENPKPNISPTPPNKIGNEEDDIISVNSTLVPIPVSVIDQNGQAVMNLKLENFQLMIDGKAAEISELSRSDSPVRLALLFDNSSSVTIARDFEKKAAIRFFRKVLRPDEDLAALYSVQTGTRLEQPLTKNVSQLTSAIENFPIPAGATALLDAIITAADYLKTVQGRRVIVIVSDGEDTISDASFEDAVRAVQADNCQVYVVKTKDFENYKRTGQRVGNANVRALSAEHRMREITAQTGGAVYSPIDEKELDQAFSQISAELSQQYVLSYYPENPDKAGQFHDISLKIKDRENLNVRTRKGYYVLK